MTLKEVAMVKLMQRSGWKVIFQIDSLTNSHYVKAERVDETPIIGNRVEDVFDLWTDDPRVANELLGVEMTDLNGTKLL